MGSRRIMQHLYNDKCCVRIMIIYIRKLSLIMIDYMITCLTLKVKGIIIFMFLKSSNTNRALGWYFM